MEATYYVIALLTAGVALVAGLNSLTIGLNSHGEKVDIIFGLQCLSLFVFILIPQTGFILKDAPPYPIETNIKRIFIWGYYGMMPFFLREYSGYRNPALKWTIVALTVISYGFYLMAGSSGFEPTWRVMVLFPLGLIFVYGLFSVQHLYSMEERKKAYWLLAAMILYGFLFIPAAINNINNHFFLDHFGIRYVPPFHLNPLAFVLIMSMRMRQDAFSKYKLEKMLRLQVARWEQLLHNTQLFIVELDQCGIIKYINPYGVKCLEYQKAEELVGRNWFEEFVRTLDREDAFNYYTAVLNEQEAVGERKTEIVTKFGRERKVTWTSTLVKDANGLITGVLGLGVDTTELDRAFKQVEDLKNELQKESLLLKEVMVDDVEHEIVGRSEAVIYAIQKAKQVADTHASVLLEGETGVGKELFANLIHKYSDRSNKPLVKVNCAALPDELIESELFGHEKGSFTGALQARKGRFELANGGTIFLDEIGEMPLSLQPKLLRVLQSGEFERIGGQQTIKVDVRLISATNRDLLTDVRKGRFREDLYYRLNVYPITIPSLKNRKTDIPLLVDHFLRKFSAEFNKNIENISRADLNRLMEYDWPGNVRELMNLLERSVILSPADTLKIDWERGYYTANGNGEYTASNIREIEKEHILKILRESSWKINGEGGAAGKLGLNPNTLRSRMKKLGITREES